ncbi:PepSY-like domain-containing protein [Sphingobacterium chuzhouense]|uniref:PepSY-like domain-containing protein n=1 Tax=Sphingobacterium chuzhouense TaxID=1742264 RepID=A0ABR7XTX7_9SPHI|nr:PepSY-like domain-containing protein [Sphingobacterium chuzhouense]MBD1422104.1 PepSY-like domain-containing protein [Sphingobacterium chuzhouense]
MKKTLFGLSLLAMVSFTMVSCDDDKVIPEGDLPQNSKNFISEHFSGQSYSRIEKDGRNYSVKLGERGSEIEVDFDANGNWIEVDADDHMHLPTGFIDAKIVNYVKTTYPVPAPDEAKSNINSIEKKASGFDVDLVAPDIDLIFNANGDFVRVDN